MNSTFGSVVPLAMFMIQHYYHKYLESGREKPRWLEMFLRKKVSTLAASFSLLLRPLLNIHQPMS